MPHEQPRMTQPKLLKVVRRYVDALFNSLLRSTTAKSHNALSMHSVVSGFRSEAMAMTSNYLCVTANNRRLKANGQHLTATAN